MKLRDALDQIGLLDDDAVIFARKPWTLDTDADVHALDSNLRVPTPITDLGLMYFLEASVAKEVLEAFGEREPTADARRALLMYYAEHDAHPEWVHQS